MPSQQDLRTLLSRRTVSLLSLACLCVAARPAVAQSGLVAAYSFNETTGTATPDATANSNNGTFNAGVTRTASGRFGGGLVFNGTSGRVTIPNSASLQLTSAMTLEAWVRPSAVPNAWRDVIYKGNDNYFLMSSTENSSRPAGGGIMGGSGIEAYGTSAIAVNTWTHLAVTYDGANVRLYVNGTQVSVAARTGAITTSTNALTLGSDSFYGQYFQGTMDEVRVYNRALSAAEIGTDMNTAIGAPDTTVPVATITGPTSSATYATNASPLTVSGTASDNVGVTQVSWANSAGGSGTASGTTAWSAAGVALTAGTNVVTVTARDAANNAGTATLTVTYDPTAPTVAFTAPTSGATFASNASPIAIGGTAGDNIGVTQVTWANNRGGSGTATGTSSWSVAAVTLQSGANILTVTARDAVGNQTTSTLTVTYTPPDTQVPTVAITSPTTGATYLTAQTSVTVGGTASDNVGVTQVSWVNSAGGSGSATGTTAWSATIPLQPGNNVITVTAADDANNQATATLTISQDAVQPTVAFTAPTSGATFSSNASPIAIGGTAGDNIGVTQVTWVNNRGGSGTATGTTSWSVAAVTLQSGANILTVTARDAVGNQTTSTLTVTYTAPDTQAPTIGITSPTSTGSYLTALTTVTVGGTASDNVGVTQVSWVNSAGGSGSATGTTAWSATIPLQPGTNVITVTAVDDANNPATATLTITQDAVLPTVAISAPAGGATVSATVTVSATASDNVGMGSVQFLVDGANSGAPVTGAGPYSISWNTVGLSNGSHTLSARATDVAGNTATSTGVTVTVSNADPTVGLVAAYAFSEASGSAITDASANGNHGTFGSGVTRTASGKFGGGLVFNGATGMATIPNSASLTLSTAMTLEAWVNPTLIDDNWRDIVYKGNDNYYLMVSTSNGLVPAGGGLIGSTSNTTQTYGTTPLSTNTWTHLAVTYDGATVRLYRNGTLVSSVAGSGNILASSNPLTLGADTFYGQYFGGTMDEVRVYNRALSVAEISTDMNTPIGGAPPPDVTLPTVAITSPTTGATYTTAGTTVSLGGTASDNVGVTQVTWVNNRGGSGTATGTTAWTAASIALQTGDNILTVTARDAANNVATATLTVTSTAGVDATAPVATITGPTSSATYATNASPLTVSGTASDNVGVTQVTWANSAGGSGTATGTTAWSAAGVALTAGTNVVTVTARDAANNAGTATLTVTYDPTAPTVAFTAPTSGATFASNASPIAIGGTAGDNIGVTQVTWVNNRGGSGTATGTSNWSVAAVTLQSGANILTVTARDAVGNQTTSTLTVTYTPPDTQVPTVAITSPTTGATYLTAQTSVTVGGTASDNVGVTQVSWVNSAGGSGSATGTTAWSATIPLQPGNNVITVTAADDANNQATATLTISQDAVQPTVAFTAPTSGATFSSNASPIAIGGTAGDNIGVTQVTWVNNRGGSGTATGTTSWSVAAVTLQSGANILTVTARDAVGNQTTSTLTVTYTAPDTQAPTIGITSPTSTGSYLTALTTVTVGGTASDNVGVTQVSWVNSAGGSGSATGTTAWSATIPLQPGSNVITVTAVDDANNPATATLTITQDAVLPTVAISAPAGGATVSATVTVSATASDNVGMGSVQFLVDGANSGAPVTGAGPYAISWNTVGLSNGAHTLSARATDVAGNTATSTGVTVTVSNADPTVGLVAAYAFSEASGSAITDASANGNHGTFGSGVTRTASGKFGGGLVFNGATGMATIPNSASLTLSTAMTLEAWVNPTLVDNNWRDIVYKGNDNYYLMVSTSNGLVPAGGGLLGSGSNTTEAYGTTPLSTNTWTHLAMTYDGTTVRLYRNGTLVSSVAGSGTIRASTNPLTLGADTFYGQYFGGTMDEVRVYNRALSVAEISTDMNTPIGGAPPPDVTLPTVAITSPTTGATYTTAGTTVSLGGTASDNVGVTQVTWVNNRGGAGTATGTTAWTAASIALQTGDNILTVTARDAANNVATVTLTVTSTAGVDGTAPTVGITTPTGSGVYLTNTASLTIGGTASDNVGVTQVTWANSAGGSGTATGTTSWSASGVALQAGVNVLTVTARDAANNVGTSTLTVTLDATAPSVALTAPAGGTTASGSAVNLTASATDNGALAGVTFLLDGVAIGSEVAGTGPNYGTTWSTIGVSNGSHTLTARARDAAGNTSVSADVVVTVNNQAPAAGLVAAYGFDETTGTSVVDASGYSNAGTMGAGVTRTSYGRFGRALSFTSGMVTISDAPSLDLTTAMTLEAWVKPSVVANAWRDVIYKGNDIYYLMGMTEVGSAPAGGGKIGGSSTTEAFGTAPLAVGTWTHLAVTYDGAVIRLYVNGVAVSSTGRTGSIQTSQNPLEIGGDSFYGQFFQGSIDEVRIYNRALSATEITSDMATPVADTGPTEDTTAPTVAITSPTSTGTYATTTGTITLGGTASDNIAVAQVSWVNNRGGAGTAAGTSAWTASAIALQSGDNILTVTARDAANNLASATLTVTFSPPADASTMGQWSAPFAWPFVSVHAALLKTGEVLSFEYEGAGGPVLWNPTTGQFTQVPVSTNLFCSGQAALPDGRILVAGGHTDAHVGITNLSIFDPVTRQWSAGPNMQFARWYPTVTGLPDGRMLITAGETHCNKCDVLLPEIYNPATNTVSTLTGATTLLPYYPHNFVMPDGNVFAAASSREPIVSKLLNVSTQTWTPVDPASNIDGGSTVMYLPGKLMKTGTSHDPDALVDPSFAKTYVIDMFAASPTWTETAPMAFPRTYHVLTSLPDGNVLVTGGGTTTDAVDGNGAALAAELWSPTTQTWQTLASGSVPRLYHGVALLLPDGRVLISGGGRFFGFPSTDPSDRLSAEIYSPPYLFKGARPVISSAPQSAGWGSTIPVQSPDAAGIASVNLIRLGSVTHAINMDQRFLPLTYTQNGNQLDVQMPGSANLAPPGYYMLFIVNSAGVPSTAAIIRIQ